MLLADYETNLQAQLQGNSVEQLKKKGQVVNIFVMPSAYVYIHASMRRNKTKLFFILRFVGMGMLCIVYSIQLVKNNMIIVKG